MMKDICRYTRGQKKKIKSFKIEIEKEKKNSADETPFTFRYLELTKELAKLKEDKKEINELWPTLDWDTITSDDEKIYE